MTRRSRPDGSEPSASRPKRLAQNLILALVLLYAEGLYDAMVSHGLVGPARATAHSR